MCCEAYSQHMNFFQNLLNKAGSFLNRNQEPKYLDNGLLNTNHPGVISFEKNPPTPGPTINENDPGVIVFKKDEPTPIPTMTPTPQPQGQVLGANTVRQPNMDRILDVAKYQGVSDTPIPLPSQNIQDLIWEYFPNEATQAAVALAGENAGFKETASNWNNDNTWDYGLFQNNSQTMNEMLNKQKYGRQLKEGGIFRPEDVQGDPRKSALASMVTRQYETDANAAPWAWWYGWQNKGYNIDPTRSIEDVANQQYPSGKNPYFKLTERLGRE